MTRIALLVALAVLCSASTSPTYAQSAPGSVDGSIPNALPEALSGYWGAQAHCDAQAQAGSGHVVDHALDAPYRLDGQWISRWHFYCRVLSLDGFAEGQFRARVLCGEDAVERGYNVDIAIEGATGAQSLNLTWYALDEGALTARPWSSGPFARCSIPQS